MTIHTHKHTRGDYSFGLTPHGPTGLSLAGPRQLL